MDNVSGIEIGRFRLRKNIAESELRACYTVMVDNHLSQQPGWRAQYLVTLPEGMFVDLAFADNPQSAERICASWQGNPYCEAFLALIEPVSMEFGTIN